MAVLQMNIMSRYLRMMTTFHIILPDRPEAEDPVSFYTSGEKYPVLWLLHGGSEDSSIWLRKTNVETYACERNLMVVMPSAYNSYYGKWPNYGGGLYMDRFIMEELMPLVHNWFPASSSPEDNFIAGNSMGGQGTIRLVAMCPDRFAGAALLSGDARDYTLAYEAQKKDEDGFHAHADYVDANGGPEVFRTGNEFSRNLLNRLYKEGRIDQLPPIFLSSGGADRSLKVYEENAAYLKSLGINTDLRVIGPYKHEWRSWELAIQEALAFFARINPKLETQDERQHRTGGT